MAIQGIFASHQGIVGERQHDFAATILRINPTGDTPLLGLTAGMPKENTSDVGFTWFEDIHQSGRTACVSGGTTTTVVVADASFYTPNTILLVEETGEHLFVTAIAGNSMTVIRGLGGTTVTAITGAHNVQKIGNAFEEASTRPTSVTQQGAPRTNYVQIFRNGWAISGTAKAVKYLTGNKLAHNKEMCATYHAEDIERSFIYGRKTMTTLNGKQFRMTDGILTQIEQYGGDVRTANNGGAGQINRTTFEDWIRSLFSYNIKGQPNERLAFCGNIALQVINRLTWVNGTYQFQAEETKLGIKVTSFVTPFGTLKLMTHALMNENPTWTKEVYAIHPGAIKKRVLRDTFPENYDRMGNGVAGIDADEGAITSEMGIQVGGARTMGIFRNLTTAVAG
ncbi:MAG: SU10 major capsid protein [Cetobacterium sp.]